MSIINNNGDDIDEHKLQQIINDNLRIKYAIFARKVIKQYLIPLSPEDIGNYKLGHKSRISGVGINTTLIFYNEDPKTKVLDEGRKAGVPLDPITLAPWIRRHGLTDLYGPSARKAYTRVVRRTTTRAAELEGVNYEIARKIARKIMRDGIPGIKLYATLPEKIADVFRAEAQGILNVIVQEING